MNVVTHARTLTANLYDCGCGWVKRGWECHSDAGWTMDLCAKRKCITCMKLCHHVCVCVCMCVCVGFEIVFFDELTFFEKSKIGTGTKVLEARVLNTTVLEVDRHYIGRAQNRLLVHRNELPSVVVLGDNVGVSIARCPPAAGRFSCRLRRPFDGVCVRPMLIDRTRMPIRNVVGRVPGANNLIVSGRLWYYRVPEVRMDLDAVHTAVMGCLHVFGEVWKDGHIFDLNEISNAINMNAFLEHNWFITGNLYQSCSKNAYKWL